MIFTTLLYLAALVVFTAGHVPLLEDWIAIHQTLHTYPLAIDSKDFSLLSRIFTEDVIADYSSGLGVLQGLSTVEETLEAA